MSDVWGTSNCRIRQMCSVDWLNSTYTVDVWIEILDNLITIYVYLGQSKNRCSLRPPWTILFSKSFLQGVQLKSRLF